ncbi:MAG: monovalent cation:proton antiporter-2 (CPA2) family protein [Pseudomonadota bacterium]
MAAPGTEIDPLLAGAAVFLGSAAVAVPLFKRIGLGSVLGYLAAGMLIGPYTLGLVADADGVRHIAEFGVVLLLFVIGLELKPSRLWRLRMEIFGLGLSQVVATTILLAGTIWVVAPTLGWSADLAIGAALALSSTAFAVQILRDRGEMTTPHGDRAFSILLFQDLAIVPLLALVAFLAPAGAEGDAWWLQAIKAVGAVGIVVLFGRYGMRPLFRAIALSHTEEIFTATALLVVVLSAALMQAAGLSMALGAFLAGVLLAESEYRHQLEADIEPFRSLFLGLFFMSVGMTVQWTVLADWWFIVIAGAFVLYAGKALFLLVLTRLARSTWPEALKIAALLGQGGEFGFVILGLGTQSRLWDPEVGVIIAAIIVLTMMMTPLAVTLADVVCARAGRSMDGIEGSDRAEAAFPVIVAGFGRFGQVVARVMALRGFEVVLIDNDPERIRIAETFGTKVYFGDLRRSDLLKLAGASQAKAIFLCGDDPQAVAKALTKLRARLPHTPIFCRAADRFEQIRLERLGATGAVREMYESSMQLASFALTKLGEGAAVEETVAEFRRRDEQLLHLQAEYGAQGGLQKLREEFSLEEEKRDGASGAIGTGGEPWGIGRAKPPVPAGEAAAKPAQKPAAE